MFDIHNKKSDFNIATFNARSIRNKLDELNYFTKSSSIHILALTETWLGPSITDDRIELIGFQTPFRRDRNESGGGVCVYLSNHVSGKRRVDLEHSDLELIWIEIHSFSHRPLLLGCCYRPPNSTVHFFERLEATLENVIDKDILLVGDFNSRNKDWFHGDITNANGLHLKELMDRLDMYQLCDEATHLNYAGEPNSLLDLGFTNVPHLFKNRATVSSPVSTSDHLPVVFHTFLKQQIKNEPSNRSHTSWLYSRKSHEGMMNSFSFDNWSWVFSDENDINAVWSRWKRQFILDIESFIPRVQQGNRDKPGKPPWFNNYIHKLIRTKNRFFKRACNSGLPEHWTSYRAARNKANNAIKMAKAKHFNHMALSLADPKCPPSKWWNLARNMCGLKGHSSNVVPPLLDKHHGVILDNVEKANILNDTFINQNTSTALENFPFGPTHTKTVFNLKNVMASEVREVLKSLPSKNSTGTDNISYRLLKEAGPGVVGPLTTLFNISLRKKEVPEEWKCATICPIFKGGKKNRQEATNYRPISLTSCVGRVLEKLLNKQLLKYLQKNSLICHQQAGFLPCQSTVTQLCSLIHEWQMALDRGENIETVFLDLSKAYDRVSIPGLIFKLSRAGFSQDALQWFSSFLTRRQQRVQVNGSYSSWETVKSGIPQGTVLGPTLFLIFINDLPECLSNKSALFADDTTSYAMGKDSRHICSTLSLDMEKATDWAKTWGMLFNAEKSEHLPITRSGNSNSHRVDMENITIPKVTTHKHLGITLHRSLKWSHHVNNIYTSAARKIGILRRLKKKLHPLTFKRIYTGAIRPQMEYACAIWSGGPTAKLIQLQRKFCRRHGISLPSLQKRFDYFTLNLFFKMHIQQAPGYLNKLLPNPASDSGYKFRKKSYPVPLVKNSSTLFSFLTRAIILWNELPADMQTLKSINSFKRALRSHLKIN